MPPRLFLPPDECWRGVSPIQAPNCAAWLNCLKSPTVATAAEAVIGPTSIADGIEPVHELEAGRRRASIDVRSTALEEDSVAGPATAHVQGVATPGVIHVDRPWRHEERFPARRAPERSMTTLFVELVGFGFDDRSGQPSAAPLATKDLADQIRGDGRCWAIEEVGEERPPHGYFFALRYSAS